jgi:hypothetical protein
LESTAFAPVAGGQVTIALLTHFKKENSAVSQDESEQAGGEQRAPAGVKVDESKLIAMYANFCRVTGTPEELIIDFGLNAHPFGPNDEPVSVGQRIVTNYFTAKRLLHALHLTVQRHEAAFGVLETDVQKRVVPQARQASRT